MRIFEINGFFNLPDNWTGTFPEAIRLVADYCEATPDKQTKLPEPSTNVREDRWRAFLEHVERGDSAHLEMGLTELNTGDNKSVRVEFES